MCLHWTRRRGHCWGGQGLVLSAGWGRGLRKGGPRLWRLALTARLPEAASVPLRGFLKDLHTAGGLGEQSSLSTPGLL